MLSFWLAACGPPSESTKETGADSVGTAPDSVVKTGTDTGDSAPLETGETDDDTGVVVCADQAIAKVTGPDGGGGCFSGGCVRPATADIDGDGGAEIILGFGGVDVAGDGWATGSVFAFEPCFTGDSVGAEGVAEVRIDGAEGENFGGSAVDGLGDVDADGIPDLMIGAATYYDGASAGRAYLFYGPITADAVSLDADAWFTVNCPGYNGYSEHDCDLGYEMTSGDVNGDGFSDVVISGGDWDYTFTDEDEFPYTGAVVLGPVYGEITMESDTDARFTSHRNFEAVGDLDGDGLCELAGNDIEDRDHVASIFSGPLSGDVSGEDATAWWTRSDDLYSYSNEVYLDTTGGLAHDLNGDGYLDVVIGYDSNDSGGDASGSVFVTYGPYSGARDLVETSFELIGTERTNAGATIVSFTDLNGDEFGDLAIGAPETSYTHGPGTVYIVPGPVVASGPIVDAASHVLAYGDGDDRFGDALADAGDADGDGISDLLVAGPGDDDGGSYAGAVWLIYGKNLQ